MNGLTGISTRSNLPRRLLANGLLLFVLLCLSPLAFGQEISDNEKQVIDVLYRQTSQCSTATHFTRLITDCRSAEKGQLSEANARYVKTLMSWAENRRGELRLDLYDDLAAAGNHAQAEILLNEAQADFESAIAHDATRWRAHLGLGRVSFSRNDWEAAWTHFNQVCELQPNESTGFFNRAEMAYSLGRYEEAKADYDKVLSLNAADLQGLTGRAHCLSQLGDHESALQDYSVVCRMKGSDPHAFLNRADARAAAADWPEAVADYQLALAKGSPLAGLRLSELLATCPDTDVRDSEQALALAEQAVADLGESPETLRAWAVALTAIGNTELAMEKDALADRLASERSQDSGRQASPPSRQAQAGEISPVKR